MLARFLVRPEKRLLGLLLQSPPPHSCTVEKVLCKAFEPFKPIACEKCLLQNPVQVFWVFEGHLLFKTALWAAGLVVLGGSGLRFLLLLLLYLPRGKFNDKQGLVLYNKETDDLSDKDHLSLSQEKDALILQQAKSENESYFLGPPVNAIPNPIKSLPLLSVVLSINPTIFLSILFYQKLLVDGAGILSFQSRLLFAKFINWSS